MQANNFQHIVSTIKQKLINHKLTVCVSKMNYILILVFKIVIFIIQNNSVKNLNSK
jgi:hypothetical protein